MIPIRAERHLERHEIDLPVMELKCSSQQRGVKKNNCLLYDQSPFALILGKSRVKASDSLTITFAVLI